MVRAARPAPVLRRARLAVTSAFFGAPAALSPPPQRAGPAAPRSEHDVNDVTVAYRSANRHPDFFVDSPANPLGFGDVKTRPRGLVRMEPDTNQPVQFNNAVEKVSTSCRAWWRSAS